MARLPRLFVPGFPQLLRLQALPGLQAFESRDHYLRFLALLAEQARALTVSVHAYSLVADQVLLLISAPQASSAGRLVQAINRVFVPWRLQGGHLWQSRFRSTVVEPGLWALRACLWVDTHPVRQRVSQDPALYPFCSFAGHTGLTQDILLTHLPVYFSLGNTPFDRQMAFRQLAEQGIGEPAEVTLSQGLDTGWLVADPAASTRVQSLVERPVSPRPRGRPRAR